MSAVEMAPECKVYTISHIYSIINNGFDVNITDDQINHLNSVFIAIDPTLSAVEKPIFKHVISCNNSNFNSSTGGDWKSVAPKSAIKKEEGIDGEFNKIRLLLNKISDKTFNDIELQIYEILDLLYTSEFQEDAISKMGKSIFEIASQNQFYSKLYAKLYAKLLEKYPKLNSSFQLYYNSYINLFDDIQYVDADIDYDKFCDINKINSNRRATSAFFINLVSFGIIEKSSITEILVKLLNTFITLISDVGKHNEVDEYVVNICLLYNKECIDPNTLIRDIPINDYIIRIASFKSSNYTSLSSKSIFKFKDLIGI